jgi:hypothetical protein
MPAEPSVTAAVSGAELMHLDVGIGTACKEF